MSYALLAPDRHERLEQHRRDSAKGEFMSCSRVRKVFVHRKSLNTVRDAVRTLSSIASAAQGPVRRGLYGQDGYIRAGKRQPSSWILITFFWMEAGTIKPRGVFRLADGIRPIPPAELISQPSQRLFPCFFRPLPLRLRPPRLATVASLAQLPRSLVVQHQRPPPCCSLGPYKPVVFVYLLLHPSPLCNA
ncbi:hypothetical protein PENSPDRAFT_469140 [Peniophora sp. CONT]|nr:hypothetical protein PENSPDRAFT_469140 [Peniophora sp. CONT]